MTKQEEGDYLYTSKKTGKTYETLGELRTAEEEYIKAQREKEEVSSARGELAKKIEDATQAYHDEVAKANRELEETRNRVSEEVEAAESKVEDLKEEWFKKGYGPFHMTYTEKDGWKVTLDKYHNTVSSVNRTIRDIFNTFFRLF